MSTFKLPDLGEGLAEAEIVAWHVRPGDRVLADQPMLSVETAKAVVEVPVPFNGTIMALHGAVGELVATGAPLVEFASETVVGTMPPTSDEEFVEAVAVRPTRPARRGAHRDAHRDAPARQRALPLVRALATRLGVDLERVAGSGPDGRIEIDDVLACSKTRARDGGRPSQAPIAVPAGTSPEPLRGARRAMARSMASSRDQVAGSTIFDDADLHAWNASRDYMPRLIRAMAMACRTEPALNAWYDSANDARILWQNIDLAVAVDTPEGLIVPVLRNVGGCSLPELRDALTAHKKAAHERSSSPKDLRDFTLMLSNFGTLAGRYGIPLVVPPAVAILGAGRVRQDAVVVADAVVAHRRMPLSLSFDHRCVTGGEACRFLAAVLADLEKSD